MADVTMPQLGETVTEGPLLLAESDGREEYVQFLHLGHEESGEWQVYDQQPLGARLPTRLWYSGLVDSGGGLNQFTSNLVRVALEGGGQKEYLDSLRRAYKQRVDAMDAALHKHIGDRATWSVPAGGFFFWLTCADHFLAAANRSPVGSAPGQFDTTGLLDAAAGVKVGFLPGRRCSGIGALGHCLRLCFAHYAIPEIQEGIRRLGQVFDSFH